MAEPILVDGNWQRSHGSKTFRATNPTTNQVLATEYPVSDWSDCENVLAAAERAFIDMQNGVSAEQLATFIERIAQRFDNRSEEICELAFIETGLPVQPRLAGVEMPRTTNQLRLAADAVRQHSWSRPTIDTQSDIRSIHAAIGPVAIFGPNNFPLAFGSLSGGDFAAALAAGNPVIAKSNSSHPGCTKLLAEEVQFAAEECNMPSGLVQMIYRTSHADGEKLIADERLAAVGYTGSRIAGLKLKNVADSKGKPIYLELSSINPVVILPGAIVERSDDIANELAGSCLLGTGQFCTSPGLIIVQDSSESQNFVATLTEKIDNAANGILLSGNVQHSLIDSIAVLKNAGAEVLCGGDPSDEEGIRFKNTVMKVSADTFLKSAEVFQTEAFGNCSLIVVANDANQMVEITKQFEGNLTGTIYAHSGDNDNPTYDLLAPVLRQKVGRLLNDKMPTGVAVSAAMNHGGPFPATGHPVFSAVGMPDTILRFSMLQCFDNVREHWLPEALQDANPLGIVRRVDGLWTKDP
ncbi:MAG: aldehyde dehydrogenase (NADP(+)), partial [Planctomycetota bacterium]